MTTRRRGHPARRRGYTTYYQRDALGPEIAKLLPNGVTTYHNYDAAGEVASILHMGPGGLLQSLYYTYDGDGRRTKIVREDGKSIYYGYDNASRLTGETWLTGGGTGDGNRHVLRLRGE